MTKILCTGGAGYLGSVLVPLLLEHGHEVTVVDNFRYRQTSLMAYCHNPKLTLINKDVRQGYPSLATYDVIIPLAALVGAPLCEREQDATESTNTKAIRTLYKQVSSEQVILFPMTNSGYKSGGSEECTEESALLPQSLYGYSKVMAEQYILCHPRGISFRFATLFGCSPRPRLDLLVNDFVHRAVTDRSLTLFEGGFRRNYLHVRDAASVFIFAINKLIAPNHPQAHEMFGQAYNVGLSSANLTKRELCTKIAEHVPGFVFHESAVGTDPDKRDYVVSNAKIEALGWKPQHTLDDGIRELIKGYAMPLDSVYRNA